MNCKETRQILVGYQENTLEKVTLTSVQNHLDHCMECSSAFNEFQELLNTIDQYQEQLPDSELEVDFYKMLEEEKLIAATSKIIFFNKRQLKIGLQIAATFVLMISSYLYGTFENEEIRSNEITVLEKEKVQIKQRLTFSLIENESASKRLQAINYMKEISHPDNDLLKVLITKMKHDKYVNVRLAAANALSKFSTNEMVRKALITTLETEENSNMQIELIQILVDIQEKLAIPSMKKLLNTKEVPSYVKHQINSELKQLI